MLDQLWFSIRIMKTTLLASIPVADSLEVAGGMKNKAKEENRRIFIASYCMDARAGDETKAKPSTEKLRRVARAIVRYAIIGEGWREAGPVLRCVRRILVSNAFCLIIRRVSPIIDGSNPIPLS